MLVASNPFFSAYETSDLFGKSIFLSLFIISILSWAILLYKVWVLSSIRREAANTQKEFEKRSDQPLGFTIKTKQSPLLTPFLTLYHAMRRSCVTILTKNRAHAGEESTPFLTTADLDLVSTHLESVISRQTKQLEKHLFVLSTVVSLAPFLGLLGTVWGSLLTLGALQQGGGAGNSAVLEGLSMALATTVLGLVVAIPALVGYNYLKSAARDFSSDMRDFATTTLTAVELHYRRVEGV